LLTHFIFLLLDLGVNLFRTAQLAHRQYYITTPPIRITIRNDTVMLRGKTACCVKIKIQWSEQTGKHTAATGRKTGLVAMFLSDQFPATM